MILTRLLKGLGYLLAVLCVFGIATQIVQFGRPLGAEHQQAVADWRRQFSETLEQSTYLQSNHSS
jgi:hypothetical protein